MHEIPDTSQNSNGSAPHPRFAPHAIAVRSADDELMRVTELVGSDAMRVIHLHPRSVEDTKPFLVNRKAFRLPTPEELVAEYEREDAAVLSLMDDGVEALRYDPEHDDDDARYVGVPLPTIGAPAIPEPPVDPENDTLPLPDHLHPNVTHRQAFEIAAEALDEKARLVRLNLLEGIVRNQQAELVDKQAELTELKAGNALLLQSLQEATDKLAFERDLNATYKLLIDLNSKWSEVFTQAIALEMPIKPAHMSNGLVDWIGMVCKPTNGVKRP